MCTAMLILASSAMAQLKNRVPDDGTAVALGSMVKLDASGEISVCGDNDGNVAGIVTAIVPEGATNYYLLAASDIYPARLAASVTAGDRLTTSAGGALRTAAVGEVTIGWALENGHATELRKAIISLDYVAIVDWDTLGAYADTSITNLILDSLAVYLLPNDTILYSDTAGFAWRIPCDSVNECIDWDTLGAYLDTLSDDGDWADSTTFLMVIGQKGVFGNSNIGYGDHDSTHVNLGVRGITGTSGQNYKYSTVSGGDWNRATHTYATVGGGYRNIAGSYGATIGGGYNNTTGGSLLLDYATIAGGLDNLTGQYGSVGGGFSNEAAGWYGTIAGGRDNSIPWSALHVSIAGGYSNTASGDATAISGGQGNNIAPAGAWSVIGGGYGNIIGSQSSTIGGGYQNRIGGIWYSTIAGGTLNEITGSFSAIPGGEADTVSGHYSFAFGRRAVVSTDYTSQFNSPYYKGILRNYGNLEFSDTLIGGIGTADTFRIFDDGDTTRFESNNPIKVGNNSLIVETNGNVLVSDTLFIGDVEEDTGTDSLLVIAANGKVGWRSIDDVSSSNFSSYKIHRTDSLKNPTTNTWTAFSMSDEVAEETFGTDFSWPYSGDSTTIQVNSTGLYQFGGCIHFKNIGVSTFSNLKILSRMVQITNSEADTLEARCSQRDWMGNLPGGHVRHITFGGTSYLQENDLIQLQYWTNTSQIIFINDNEFDNEVSASLWLTKLR